MKRSASTALGWAKGRQTQWAAQFAVASELCKRGYQVGFTQGNNTQFADLLVFSPRTKVQFLIDVKGLAKPAPWLVKLPPERSELFYVLAYVPEGKSNEYYVMAAIEVRDTLREYWRRHPRDQRKMSGFAWKDAGPFRDAWGKLPN